MLAKIPVCILHDTKIISTTPRPTIATRQTKCQAPTLLIAFNTYYFFLKKNTIHPSPFMFQRKVYHSLLPFDIFRNGPCHILYNANIVIVEIFSLSLFFFVLTFKKIGLINL